MNNEIRRLHEERHRTWSAMRETSDRIAAEGREFSAEEERTWQRQNAALDSLDARIGAMLDLEQREQQIDASLGGYGSPSNHRAAADVRAVLTGERRSVDLDLAAIEHRDILRSGTGANIVPQGFAPTLVEAMLQTAVVASVATRFVTDGVGSFRVPVATVHPTSSTTAEAAQITESDPTFAQIDLGAYKFATFTEASRETLEDSGVDLEGYLARRCGEAVGNDLGAALVTGNGTTAPQGIVSGSTQGVIAASATAITMDELIDLMHTVGPQYRSRPATGWLMNDATAAKIRKLREGAGTGAYLWEPSAIAGRPDLLLGHPVYIDPSVPASTAGLRAVLFGDMGCYGVRFAGQLRFERSDDFRFQHDLAAFRCVLRADGKILDGNGLRHLRML